MRGHADQIRGRCMRLGMGMRGFGGKRISKRETEPSIKKFETFALIQSHREIVCAWWSHYDYREGGYSRRTEPKKSLSKKINSRMVWNNVPRPVGN